MAKQIFPGVEELLDIIFAELPEGVYATDRADAQDPEENSNSSAELRAQAMVLADLYANLKNINDDKFLTTVTHDGLTPWEKELFDSAQDATQSDAIRQANLIAKIRANGGISLPAIRAVIHGVLDPVGLTFEIFPYSGQGNGNTSGAWLLGYSELGADTYLAKRDPLYGAQRGPGITPLDCNLDYVAAGITLQDLRDIQETAYKYEVQIYGHADAQTLARLNQKLTALEPARSDHFIRNDAPGPVDPVVPDLSLFSENTNSLETVVDRLAVVNT